MSDTISADKAVTIHYTLKGEDGSLIESSLQEEPLCYLHGRGQIVAGLETALAGRKLGDKFSVLVKPEEGYGMYNEDLLATIPRARFNNSDKLALGATFYAQDKNGETFAVRIDKLTEDEVVVDGNHPLAGKSLTFEVEIVGVRDASAEELEHGHMHGAKGCGCGS